MKTRDALSFCFLSVLVILSLMSFSVQCYCDLTEPWHAFQAQLKELSEQVEIMKSALSKAGNDHEAAQAENQATQAELEKKRLRLDDMRKRLAANRHKLKSDYMHLDTLESKEKELEALHCLENKRMTEVGV
jgi:predicted nuclease with TOPRIM domain